MTETEFQPYYDQCYRSVRAYLRHYARPGDVEDLMQETWLRAWENRAQYRGDMMFSAWVQAIARNAMLDQVRKRNASKRCAEEVEFEEFRHASGAPSVELHLVKCSVVTAAMRGVDKKTATIMRMRFVYGMTEAEVDECAGIPVGVQKRRLHNLKLRNKRQV